MGRRAWMGWAGIGMAASFGAVSFGAGCSTEADDDACPPGWMCGTGSGEGGSTSTSAECSDDDDCWKETHGCQIGVCNAGQCASVPSMTEQCFECSADQDCAQFDDDEDPCTVVRCAVASKTCFDTTTDDPSVCACDDDFDCDHSADTQCLETKCEDHLCVPRYAPAGQAPEQIAGDCAVALCDGTTSTPTLVASASDLPADEPGDCKDAYCDGTTPYAQTIANPNDVGPEVAGDCKVRYCNGQTPSSMIDTNDVPDDDNVCTIDSCDPTFGTKKHEPSQNGIACTDAAPGYCFQGYCMDDCAPMNPSSCGGEGADRPTNNSGTTATDFQYPVMCGFLANGDVDWYDFHAVDEDFSYDVLNFYVWSQASQVQVCAYVKCDDGTAPGGGCSTKSAGPNGSQGCCWTGSGATFHQTWDLDCGSSEDSGQVYVKVNSTGLLPPPDACDQYSVQMYY